MAPVIGGTSPPSATQRQAVVDKLQAGRPPEAFTLVQPKQPTPKQPTQAQAAKDETKGQGAANQPRTNESSDTNNKDGANVKELNVTGPKTTMPRVAEPNLTEPSSSSKEEIAFQLGEEMEDGVLVLHLVVNGTVNGTQICMVLLRDCGERDVTKLKNHLAKIEKLLTSNLTLFAINAPLGVLLDQDEVDDQGHVGVWSAETTLLGVAARLGWVEGLQAMVEWDRGRKDQGERLNLDARSPSSTPSGCKGGTALHLAVEAESIEAVRYLISQGASAGVDDTCGYTPLEAAVERKPATIIKELLECPRSQLADGMISLRMNLSKAAAQMPTFLDRWPFGSAKVEYPDPREKLVPVGLRPLPKELEVIGGEMNDWVLFYQCRVMCAFAHNVLMEEEAVKLLSKHGYDAFARDFMLVVVTMCIITGFFFMFMLIVARIRVYGWMEVPVSLVDAIPGAFDPARLVDPDFDPSRQKAKLPYWDVKMFVDQVPPCLCVNRVFWKALLGSTSSWLLQFVRIPPERDPYDEDYLSEDDEDSRTRVRMSCSSKARTVQRVEVALRCILLVALLWWLCERAGRWGDAYLLILMYIYSSWFASSAARSASPVPVPEKTPDDVDPVVGKTVDSARLINGLFSVQHGPRWTRAITTTRSTAAPNRGRAQRKARRARNGRGAATASDNASGAEANNKDDEDTFSMASLQAMRKNLGSSDTTSQGTGGSGPGLSFYDIFQRSFLQSGQLHIRHGEVLVGNVVSILIIAFVLVWLQQLRRFMVGSYEIFYEVRNPVQLFEAYGPPGSAQRCLAVFFEILFLWLCGERIYSITSLLRVAAYALRQRLRALNFLHAHPPPPLPKSVDRPLDLKEAIERLEETVSCSDFALEMSTVRWMVLRGPVELVFFCTIKAFVIALLLSLSGYVEDSLQGGFGIDPLVPFCVGTCIVYPLVGALMAGAAANREVGRLRQKVLQATDEVLSATPVGEDHSHEVQYVQLRTRAAQALSNSTLAWPHGRELGLLEPVLVLLLYVLAMVAIVMSK